MNDTQITPSSLAKPGRWPKAGGVMGVSRVAHDPTALRGTSPRFAQGRKAL